jgi:hypothetical protein
MQTRIGWTGHRPDLFADPAVAQSRVEILARELAQAGAQAFVTGGQRGVDTWAGFAAIDLAVPYTVILPLSQEAFTAEGWTDDDREMLRHLLSRATEVQIAHGYSDRNRRVATSVDLLVAVWTGTRGGGTAETLQLAREARTPIREVLLPPNPHAASAQARGI